MYYSHVHLCHIDISWWKVILDPDISLHFSVWCCTKVLIEMQTEELRQKSSPGQAKTTGLAHATSTCRNGIHQKLQQYSITNNMQICYHLLVSFQRRMSLFIVLSWFIVNIICKTFIYTLFIWSNKTYNNLILCCFLSVLLFCRLCFTSFLYFLLSVCHVFKKVYFVNKTLATALPTSACFLSSVRRFWSAEEHLVLRRMISFEYTHLHLHAFIYSRVCAHW